MNQRYEKGDVVFVELGQVTSGIVGNELAKARPCIVINAFDRLGLAIVVPVSTKSLKYGVYNQVRLEAGTNLLCQDQ